MITARITPAILKRMEAAGFKPGEYNPVTWLIAELEKLKIKNERLSEQLNRINKAEVDRWKDGGKATSIKIAKWLRRSCQHPNHDDRWCQICETLKDAADRIDDGTYLSWEE